MTTGYFAKKKYGQKQLHRMMDGQRSPICSLGLSVCYNGYICVEVVRFTISIYIDM